MDQFKGRWQYQNRALAIVLVVLMTATFSFYNAYVGSRHQIVLITANPEKANFLVWSPNCQIPQIEVLNEDTRFLFHSKSYKRCSQKKPLTYIRKDSNNATLYIDSKAIRSYNRKGVNCCIKYITRDGSSKQPDDDIKYTDCQHFKEKITLENEFVVVTCNGSSQPKKQIYENAHSVVTITPQVEEQMKKYKDIKPDVPVNRHISLLFIGIDSVSRTHLYRSMPKTAAFLQANDWIELKGYNKVGDNTFPNLCALLLGMEKETVYKQCNPMAVGGLDKCEFIWKKFHRYGYVTAYAEDSADINTFNYYRKGFKTPPTDYYLRPFVIGSEKSLHNVKEYGIPYCIGPESSSERILDYAKDFSTTFKHHPNFGFFWMSSFSHNDLSFTSSMDQKFMNFISDLHYSNITDNSIIVFFSDHGIRFGEILKTTSGWYEERLPMFNMWLPMWFREIYEEKYNSLIRNTRKLSSPYDMYMTLQDILSTVIDNRDVNVSTSTGCPNCQSLFTDISENRSCQQAGINQHYCTCYGYKKLNKINETMKAAGAFMLQTLNDIIKLPKYQNESKPCVALKMNHIRQISVSEKSFTSSEGDSLWYLLVSLYTVPGNGLFESTFSLRYNNSKPIFEQLGAISRLNMYGDQSRCVSNINLKKYCYCR